MRFLAGGAERARISTDGTFRVTGAGTAGSTDAVQFSGSAAANSLILDSSGNLGVGTSSLDLVGSTTTLTIDKSGGNGQLSLKANGTTLGRIFADYSTSELRIGNPTANPVTIFTNNNERMRIDSSGNLLVGTTSTGGSASNTARVVGGVFSTFNSTPSIPHNTATTVATLPSGDAIYLASAALQSSGAPTGYNELAVIRVSLSTAAVTVLVDAAVLSISVSGLNVQITHGQGATQPCPFALIRLL
jgi:hypothetical protein